MGNFYTQPEYLTSESDYMQNMDYFAIANLQVIRSQLLESESAEEIMEIFLTTEKEPLEV